jgi:hypothetical protein
VPLPELEPVGTLRCPQPVAGSVLVVPSRPELAPALVLASWNEPLEVPEQDLSQRGSELPSASPALEQAMLLPLFRFAWPVSVPQVRRLVPPSPQRGLEMPPASLEQARPWLLFWVFWPMSVPQVRRLVPPSRLRPASPSRSELPLIQEGTSSNTLHSPATTETLTR